MKSKILELLQSYDEDSQRVGLVLYESIGCSQADKWFDGLRVMHNFIYPNKKPKVNDLIKLYNRKLLDLQYLNIRSIPKEIGLLKKLTDLYLNCNELLKLPDTIGNLSNLEILCVDHNYIGKLPDSICNLHKLKDLHASCNKLIELPKNLGEIKSLEWLNIINNDLFKLPVSLMHHQNLIRIQVAGNTSILYDHVEMIMDTLPKARISK